MTRPEPGPIALRAAQDALKPSVLAVREQGGNNRGLWVERFLRCIGLAPGNPWCVAWCQWRLREAAEALNAALPTWWTRTGSVYKAGNSLWRTAAERQLLIPGQQRGSVRVGDLALLAWSKPYPSHVGIVVGFWADGVIVVEGNTNGDGSAEGDGVYKKHRHWSEIGANGAFVRLPF